MQPLATGPRYYVTAPLIRPLLLGMRVLGLDVLELLRSTNVPVAVLDDPDTRVDLPYALELMRAAVTASGDQNLGLHLAQLYQPGAFGTLDHLAHAAPTLGAALDVLCRYERMHQNGMHTEVRSEEGRTTIRHTMVHPYPVPRQISENTLANLLVIARRLTGIAFRPLELWIAHPAPASTSEHQSLFGCSIRWGAPDDRMVIDTALLAAQLPNSNPALVAALEAHARGLVARLSEGLTFADQVRRALCSVLSRGALSLPNVARCMGTSPRTLQRKLAAEGTSTAQLLDDVRRELSIVYLQRPQLAIGDIALLVGFSDERAFRRAFRRWLGTSPSKFRRLQSQP